MRGVGEGRVESGEALSSSLQCQTVNRQNLQFEFGILNYVSI